MVTKKLKHSLLAVSIFIICAAVRCNKLVCDADAVYAFELGITARPDNETVKVGDTIWLEINEPDRLLDHASNSMVTFSGVENLSSVISFQKLVNSSFSEKALNQFELILKQGTLVNNKMDPELFNEYFFQDNNGFYKFMLGVSPQDTGIYRIFFSNAANVYRKSDKCTKASFTLNFSNTNQHYEYYPGGVNDPQVKSGVYYFKVVN